MNGFAHVFKYNHNHGAHGLFSSNSAEYVGGMASAMQHDAEHVKATQERNKRNRDTAAQIKRMQFITGGQGKRFPGK